MTVTDLAGSRHLRTGMAPSASIATTLSTPEEHALKNTLFSKMHQHNTGTGVRQQNYFKMETGCWNRRYYSAQRWICGSVLSQEQKKATKESPTYQASSVSLCITPPLGCKIDSPAIIPHPPSSLTSIPKKTNDDRCRRDCWTSSAPSALSTPPSPSLDSAVLQSDRHSQD